MADTTPSQPGGTSQPAREYRPSRGRRVGDAIISDGKRWLVAPYGPVSWVHNARAAGRVTLRRRRRDTLEYAVREVSPQEAGPVLRRYVDIATATQPYFQAAKDASVEAFIAEADRHPVFELTPLTRGRPDDG
jgi:hypothetical protein